MTEQRYLFFCSLILMLPFSICIDINPESTANFIQFFRNAATDFVKNVFYDFSGLVRHVTEAIGAAIEEDCKYKCPNGKTPRPNPFYEPKGNGCGIPGLNIPKYIPIGKFEKCCDEHDICYGTCNKNKEKCDEKFKGCLYKICSSLEKFVSEEILNGCKVVAKTLYTAVTAMGCKYYLEAQKDACICKLIYYDNVRDEL